MKYFVHFYFNFKSTIRDRGMGRTIIEMNSPISSDEELDALEETIAYTNGYEGVTIINLQELST